MSRYEFLNQKGWLYCINSQIKHAQLSSSSSSTFKIYSDYKLHVAIPISFFDSHSGLIFSRLIKAMEDGTIPQFKLLNIGNVAELEKQITPSRARIFNNPFTIYLFQDFDRQAVVELCHDLENLLTDVPSANREFLSIADLDFSAHLTFRQEKLNGEYIKINGTSQTELQKLEEQGKASDQYQGLLLAMHTAAHSGSSDERADKERESEIRKLYNLNFAPYHADLHSTNNRNKFSAALNLLGIAESQLKQGDCKEKGIELIQKKFRAFARKNHPDKVKNICYQDTVDKANNLFTLYVTAKEILISFMKGELILEETVLPSNPQYSAMQRPTVYDVMEQIRACRDFVSISKSSAKVAIKKHWNMEYESNADGRAATGSEIVIYNPVVTIYEEPRDVLLPGYQAFYYLFLSGELPVRFDQGYLDEIISYFASDESEPDAAKWLLEKVLNHYKFIVSMDSFLLLSTAIKATEKGIVTIGNTEIEVIAWYYQNHPETFYARRVEKYFDHDPYFFSLNLQELEQVFTGNPGNLIRMNKEGLAKLVEFIPSLLPTVLSSKNLTRNLSSYFLEYRLLEPFFKQLESGRSLAQLQHVMHVTLVELIFGSTAFLPLLSRNALLEYQQFVIQNQAVIPIWVNDEIDFELYDRDKAGKTLVSTGHGSHAGGFWLGFQKPRDPKDFILDTFVSGKYGIVCHLNEQALLWLASEPEVHCSTFLIIAKALIPLNGLQGFDGYLKKLAEEQGIDFSNMSALELYGALLQQEDKINQSNQEWLTGVCDSILDEYDQLLRGADLDIDGLKHRTKRFGLHERCQIVLNQYKQELNQQFFQLMERVRNGERSESLKNDFIALKHTCDYLEQLSEKGIYTGIEWKYFSRAGSDEQDIRDELSFLHCKLFQIQDSVYLYKYRYKSNLPFMEKYGLNKEEGFYTNLHLLYLVYEYLQLKEDFYEQFMGFATGEIKSYGYYSGINYEFSQLVPVLKGFAARMLGLRSNTQTSRDTYSYHQSFIHRDPQTLQSLYIDLGLTLPAALARVATGKPGSTRALMYQGAETSGSQGGHYSGPVNAITLGSSPVNPANPNGVNSHVSGFAIDEQDLQSIRDTITSLETEMQSCFCFFKARKQNKAQGLKNIMGAANKSIICSAIRSEKSRNSDLTKGIFSTRTASLLSRLEEKYKDSGETGDILRFVPQAPN